MLESVTLRQAFLPVSPDQTFLFYSQIYPPYIFLYKKAFLKKAPSYIRIFILHHIPGDPVGPIVNRPEQFLLIVLQSEQSVLPGRIILKSVHILGLLQLRDGQQHLQKHHIIYRKRDWLLELLHLYIEI